MTSDTAPAPPIGPGGTWKRPTTWGRWKLSRYSLVHRFHPGGFAYEVALDDINSHLALLDWLLHIAGKGDGMEPANFARALRAIFGAGAIHGPINGKASVKAYCGKA